MFHTVVENNVNNNQAIPIKVAVAIGKYYKISLILFILPKNMTKRPDINRGYIHYLVGSLLK